MTVMKLSIMLMYPPNLVWNLPLLVGRLRWKDPPMASSELRPRVTIFWLFFVFLEDLSIAFGSFCGRFEFCLLLVVSFLL